MSTADERLNDWLRDAHAMEEQAEQMLSAQASRIEHYPQLKARIEQHIRETQAQAVEIRSCIERRGSSTSGLKDMAGRVTAMAQGMGGMFVGDEVVKGAMAGYTFEHFEISAYTSLVAAAEAAGDVETAAVCRRILSEEEAMAAWMRDNLDAVVRQFLARDEAGVAAKR